MCLDTASNYPLRPAAGSNDTAISRPRATLDKGQGGEGAIRGSGGTPQTAIVSQISSLACVGAAAPSALSLICSSAALGIRGRDTAGHRGGERRQVGRVQGAAITPQGTSSKGCRVPGTDQSLAHRAPLLILSAAVLVGLVVVVNKARQGHCGYRTLTVYPGLRYCGPV
ncbi:unnamed protein product [Gadus morhua 'NCC']